MNSKVRTLLAVSLAAILSVSLVAISGFPEAVAAGEKKHFKTADCRLADPAQKENVETQLGVTVNPDGTLKGADCVLQASFNKDGTALKYSIKLKGIQLIDSDGDPTNDVGKMHIHKAAMFVDDNPDNPKGPMHVLNIFREPAMDDRDLVIKAVQQILRGIWDDGDAVDREGDHDDTFEVTSEFIRECICKGELFLMVHGQTVDENGAVDGKPGFIKASIQPTAAGKAFCDKKLGVEV